MCPRDLPRVQIDRTLIARSLTNIVENALHAMPSAGTLGVAAAPDDHHVRIRISDTGVGMDPEALERAFEPYFSTKATGTGLGLPIAKRNVELTGGTIAVTSERDRGTTVELTAADRAYPVILDFWSDDVGLFFVALRLDQAGAGGAGGTTPAPRTQTADSRRQERRRGTSGCAAKSASTIATSSSTV